jgi:hypothetical protein
MSSKFFAASSVSSAILILRQTACTESFLSYLLVHFYLLKKFRQSAEQAVFGALADLTGLQT